MTSKPPPGPQPGDARLAAHSQAVPRTVVLDKDRLRGLAKGGSEERLFAGGRGLVEEETVTGRGPVVRLAASAMPKRGGEG